MKKPVRERRRFDWWWFETETSNGLPSDAAAWEMLRRTEYYPRLWRTHIESSAHCKEIQNQKNLGHMLRLPLDPLASYGIALKQFVGDSLSRMLWASLDPKQSWIKLTEDQRNAFKNEATFLPRQFNIEQESPMDLGLIELKQDTGGGVSKRDLWHGGCDSSIAIHPIPIKDPKVFVAIRFDVRLSGEALERQLDDVLMESLVKPHGPGKSKHPVQAVNWASLEKHQIAYPVEWKQAIDEYKQFRAKEPLLRVLPTDQAPLAVCLIPASCELRIMRERFHNQLRPEQRRKWVPNSTLL